MLKCLNDKMTKIEERLALAKPHERVVGRLVGVSNCDAV